MPFGFRKRISLERFNLRDRMASTSSDAAYETGSLKESSLPVPPTLIVEPSSDGSEPDEALVLLKPRSNSYSNSHEAADGLSSSEEAPGARDSNWFLKLPRSRRRGRSLDVPKTCVHCVLAETWHKQKGKQQTAAMAAAAAVVATAAAANLSGEELPPEYLPSPSGSPPPGDAPTPPPSPSCFLQVPCVTTLKPRASSLDAAIYRSYGDEDRRSSLEIMATPDKPRAISVDVNLPTDLSNRYSPRKSVTGVKTKSLVTKQEESEKAIASSSTMQPEDSNLLHPKHAESSYRSNSAWKSTVDWGETAVNGEHIWIDTSASGDFCYVTEAECCKNGQKKKCTACKIIIHADCLSKLEKINFRCKPTFREATLKNYRDGRHGELFMRHHWVHRRRQEGKCKQCGKSFQQKFPFNNKDVIAISCSWCKTAYHNKITCFMMQQIAEPCSLGIHASIVVPPSWIIKIPRKNAGRASMRKRGMKVSLKRRKSSTKLSCPFVIKPIPSPHVRPIVVFINPRSGGNQGAKLLHKFHYLLNPRQVFDLSLGGPKQALEFYRKVPNLRLLACGGDGTVGWLLSVMDALNMNPFPPVAVLPLGTGNDLARVLNWGSGYTDEPLSKILSCVEDGKVILLDRWNISIDPSPQPSSPLECTTPTVEKGEDGESQLPYNVFNNYFSLGADAATILEFHESREANPEKFNSRLSNKMFIAGVGGKDLLKRSWRDLCESLTLLCDDQDLTSRIRDLKLHCILFLNIQRYSAGTIPWGNPTCNTGFEPQRMDDGYLEVIGFTSTSLATVQVGGHGLRLCQCRQVKLTTKKTIPMQVDGEPCRLQPSVIHISLRNQAKLIQKPKRRNSIPLLTEDGSEYGFGSPKSIPERLRLQVSVVSMTDYEEFVFDKERLQQTSHPLGIIVVDNDSDLETVRKHIDRLAESTHIITPFTKSKLSDKWMFLDSTTAERFFRIDKQQESLHYVTDISSEDLYILDPEFQTCLPEFLIQSASSMDDQLASLGNYSATTSIAPSALSCSRRVSMPGTSPGMCLHWRRASNISSLIGELDRLTPLATSQHNNSDSSSEPGSPHSPALSPEAGRRLQVRRNSYRAFMERKLMEACKRGELDLVRELHNDSTSLDCIDASGMTCLHHASRFGHKDVVKYLLENASPHILDAIDFEKNQTALHKAAWYQRRIICKLLVAAGASLTAVDSQGLTPREQALKAEDKELATYLEEQEHSKTTPSKDLGTPV